jgi:hypothetical protein
MVRGVSVPVSPLALCRGSIEYIVSVDFQVYEPQWTTCCTFLATNAENRAISVDPRDKPKDDRRHKAKGDRAASRCVQV